MLKKLCKFGTAFSLLTVSMASFASAAATQKAVLQGLDKVTARVSTFEVELDETVKFGALSITVKHCDRTPPEEPPESTAFLEVFEVKRGETAQAVFTGWMFASSPALSAMEHPVYDIWVLECKS
ncbi:MAG: DUF2155 domain-containing protein [Alphaproteobacteria bacterium]|nr:DUF2155 domain-containing protein [Alphaproteobacteria bacterium]